MDIYFEENYGKLYEKAENGKAVVWRYQGEEGSVLHQFLIRPIPVECDGQVWYDLVTPYGYGGPLVERVNEGYDRQTLVAAFERAFGEYCRENRVVSEFVRFHILENNVEDFQGMYESSMIRHTVGTNLKDYDDPVASEFSKRCRKNIRQAVNKGISWRVTPRPESLENFKEIYYSTMDRNNAGEFYYFDDEYFADMQKYFHDNLLFVEAVFEDKTIAAGLYFIWDKVIHIHLSGTYTDYLYLSPAYILRYATTLWGKENGYDLIFHGGGRSNAEDDSLYLFKKQFGQNTDFLFWTGKKIWNQEIYDRLCQLTGATGACEYFPAYRA